MPIPNDQSAWAELIDGDIDWLLKQERGLERDHIIETLRELRRTGPVDAVEPRLADQTPEEKRVIELYGRGYTGPEVADRLRLKRSRVYTILRKGKVKRRRSGPRDGHGYKGPGK